MKNFDTRWKNVAKGARQARPREDPAPFGFAARIVAHALPTKTSADDFTWDRLISRFLIGAAALLILCAAMEWRHLRNARPLDPGIENSVAQLVWTL